MTEKEVIEFSITARSSPLESMTFVSSENYITCFSSTILDHHYLATKLEKNTSKKKKKNPPQNVSKPN